MSILFMMERNLSNFWKCLIFHYSTVCITQKIVLKAKDLIKIYFIIHEGKKPVKFITLSILKRGPKIDMSILFLMERNMSNFWKIFLQSLHLCLFFALKVGFLCHFLKKISTIARVSDFWFSTIHTGFI